MHTLANFTGDAPAYIAASMDIAQKVQWLLDFHGWKQADLASRLDTTQPTVNRWLNGSDPRGSMREKINALFEASRQGNAEEAPAINRVRLVGKVGADPSGRILYGEGDDVYEWIPVPPGGSISDSALLVAGFSMRGYADDGAIIYYSTPQPPTEDFLGEVVVCEVDTGERLVKRMLRGSRRGVFDLESINGETRRDQRLLWIAEITNIVPPRNARRLLRGETSA